MMQEQNRRYERLLKLMTPQLSVSQSVTLISAYNIPIIIKNKKINVQDQSDASSSASAAEDKGKEILSTPYKLMDRMEDIPSRTNFHIPYPKLDFSTFSREEPREWDSKYEQYFKIYQISITH